MGQQRGEGPQRPPQRPPRPRRNARPATPLTPRPLYATRAACRSRRGCRSSQWRGSGRCSRRRRRRCWRAPAFGGACVLAFACAERGRTQSGGEHKATRQGRRAARTALGAGGRARTRRRAGGGQAHDSAEGGREHARDATHDAAQRSGVARRDARGGRGVRGEGPRGEAWRRGGQTAGGARGTQTGHEGRGGCRTRSAPEQTPERPRTASWRDGRRTTRRNGATERHGATWLCGGGRAARRPPSARPRTVSSSLAGSLHGLRAVCCRQPAQHNRRACHLGARVARGSISARALRGRTHTRARPRRPGSPGRLRRPPPAPPAAVHPAPTPEQRRVDSLWTSGAGGSAANRPAAPRAASAPARQRTGCTV